MAKRTWVLLSMSYVMATGCGGDDAAGDPCQSLNPPPSCGVVSTDNNTNSSTNNLNSNVTNSENSTVNNVNSVANNVNACAPRTECPEDTCGTADDGCGGTLECEPCPCDGTTVVKVGCGACDLGVRTCDGVVPTGKCDFPEVFQTIDPASCEEHFYYVSVTAASDGDGRKSDPMNDLLSAIDRAAAENKLGVIVGGAQGGAVLDAPLRLVEGIHIVGGFDTQFRRTATQTSLTVSKTQAGYSLGLLAVGIEAPTHVSGLSITAENADTWAIGAMVQNSPGLELARMRIQAGDAGRGLDGADGQGGLNGTDGNPGNPGKLHVVLSNGNASMVGGAATSGRTSTACSLTGGSSAPREASGGGGCGQTRVGTQLSYVCGSGGAGGVTSSATAGFPEPLTARDGANAAEFADGAMAGANGTPDATMREDSTLGFWVPDVSSSGGSAGIDGAPGAAGAGGGGAPTDGIVAAGHCGGPGGASGGTGGCGGLGGGGGGGGWPSYGIVFHDSSQTRTREVEALAGNGGVGGDGGDGGAGGQGGNGGQGARLCDDGSEAHTRGGDGGNGADGQTGGSGGGGAGGDSIAVVCLNAPPVLDGITPVAGAAGAGGQGGDAPALTGQTTNISGCDEPE